MSQGMYAAVGTRRVRPMVIVLAVAVAVLYVFSAFARLGFVDPKPSSSFVVGTAAAPLVIAALTLLVPRWRNARSFVKVFIMFASLAFVNNMLTVLGAATKHVKDTNAKSQLHEEPDLNLFYELAVADDPAALEMVNTPGFETSVDAEGHTPLFAAAFAGNRPLLEAVLAKPHDLEHRDNQGNSVVWFLAIQEQNLSILELLLSRGASPDQPNDDGMSPIMAAAQVGNLAALPILVYAGAAVDQTNHEGATALHLAIAANDVEAAQTLLELGADPALRYQGKSALELAEAQDAQAIIELLRK